jgi:hypothetical protein
MPHLYGGNVVLGTNDIHQALELIDKFEDFKRKAELKGFEVRQLLWLPNSHTVFILFHVPDGFHGDPEEVLAALLLTELPKGVESFTVNQAYTSPELRLVVNPPPPASPPSYASGGQEGA